MISYPRSDLCIYPTAMRPASDGSAASSRLSGLLIPKTKASVAAAVGAATAQKLAAPPGSGSPRIPEVRHPQSGLSPSLVEGSHSICPTAGLHARHPLRATGLSTSQRTNSCR